MCKQRIQLEIQTVGSTKSKLHMASVNLEKLLGASAQAENTDFVATVGGDLLDPNSQVVAIFSQRSERVDIL
ncbi:hypothetical protein GGU10DRAFT_367812 [Lentinula aff. detonsa]|uniref:Uncharacterized protein n=1 Tax=Lentinula aff. detonsa TaxID=2804958 RepID=A0AA38NNN3_9AGAR|nr:hypothetical protein GGU10DRAFT_367812 [Lentinula aff. detonsa]